MTEFFEAPDAQVIADRLVRRLHSHLDGIRVECVFRDKAAKRSGQIVLGRARRVGGLNAFLARRTSDGEDTRGEPFFVIELAKDEWDELSPRRRRALVDHELSHCTAQLDDANRLKLGTRGHDVEEFIGIVMRHGLWDDGLQLLAKAAAEDPSDLDDDGDDDEDDDEVVE